MINKLLVYKSISFNPYENLAVEKYLLDLCPADCFVLYLWQNENTVVIGKNQNPWAECKCKELETDGGFLARRLSGGGAVFHDKGNLNFTFISSTENYDLNRNLEIIKTACKYAGIKTKISGRNDILADGRKFSGNAFYSSKGKSYHHGTILIDADKDKMTKYLTPSKAKLEAKGVKSVRSRTINLTELSPSLTIEKMQEYFIQATEETLRIKAEPIIIQDKACIDTLSEKYSSPDWLYGSTLPFTARFQGHFEWGNIELLLNVKKGVIQDLQTFTDSMDETLSEQLSKSLINCKFDLETISKRLSETLCSNVANDIISIINKSEI